jgi:oligosaccharide reducing-end xylanase
VTVSTGGSAKADGGEASGGRPGDAAVDRGGGADRPLGGSGGGGAGGSATGGSVVNPPVDGGGGGAGPGCTPPTTYPNLFVTVSGHTQAESDDKVAKAWSSLFNSSSSGTIYFDGPGSDESYIKDIYNGDVRTEGMSYGMMAAVQLDHQKEFDRIWTWVRNHMAKGCSGDKCTGEIAWSCPTSGNCNNGGAPDGEEYMATALIFAHTRWGDAGKIKYGTEAQWVLDVIRTKYFHTNPHIIKFVANSSVTDPSYVLPAFYQVWACFDAANADFWNTAVKDGRAFFPKDVDGNGVCPYQANWTGGQTAGANSDSVRCVMNIMMDWNFFKADTWQSQTYAPKFAAHEKNAGPPSSYCDATLGFGLPAADGKAFVDKIWSAGVPSRDYWNGVLYMLSLLHVSGNFKLYY